MSIRDFTQKGYYEPRFLIFWPSWSLFCLRLAFGGRMWSPICSSSTSALFWPTSLPTRIAVTSMWTGRRKSPIVQIMLEMWPFCERVRERERGGGEGEREIVIGIGCKTVEDNGSNQEVSSTDECCCIVSLKREYFLQFVPDVNCCLSSGVNISTEIETSVVIT